MKVNLMQQSSSAVYCKGQSNGQDPCEKSERRTCCSLSCEGLTVKPEVKLEVVNSLLSGDVSTHF